MVWTGPGEVFSGDLSGIFLIRPGFGGNPRRGAVHLVLSLHKGGCGRLLGGGGVGAPSWHGAPMCCTSWREECRAVGLVRQCGRPVVGRDFSIHQSAWAGDDRRGGVLVAFFSHPPCTGNVSCPTCTAVGFCECGLEGAASTLGVTNVVAQTVQPWAIAAPSRAAPVCPSS